MPKPIEIRKPTLTMLVATELTTEDLLEIFIEVASRLTYQRDRALADAASWKSNFKMYRNAWMREAGGRDGKFIAKSHEIDGLVLTTKWLYDRAMKWEAYLNGQAGRDPFWFVPEPEPPCPDCEECAKGAYSDATTPGFFHAKCAKHREVPDGQVG